MHYIDKKINELYAYKAERTAQADLDDFWEATLQEAAHKPLNGFRERTDVLPLYTEAYKVTYEGFDTTPIHGWYLLPKALGSDIKREKLPCIVSFHGYTGSKGIPHHHAALLLSGYAVFAVDVRGQGGETGNLLAQQFGMTRGWMTQGILDPYEAYYRAIAVDGIQAVEWLSRQPEIDPERIIVAGESQGGGLALLMGALSSKPCMVLADIPNMCHMDYGIFHSTGSLKEAAEFVEKHPDRLEQVLRTLSYFDILNLHNRIRVPVLMSVGLKDTVCVPESIFAVYNQLQTEKELSIFPFNGHFTSRDHILTRMEFINKH
ncbi:MAG: acetyl xylan esterase [Paenibacillus sp.]|jgi:cephalosporin-C deacetylase|nr:acetyl xylan esterase [Paenibacillus sp.]